MPEVVAENVTEISFDGLFENRPEKIFSVLYSSVTVVVCAPLLYAAIWHGRFGSDSKKTLVDLLASLLCWILIFYLVVIQVIDILIYTLGPLPYGVCFLQVYLKVLISLAFFYIGYNTSHKQNVILFSTVGNKLSLADARDPNSQLASLRNC